jgi:hypothetical protein
MSVDVGVDWDAGLWVARLRGGGEGDMGLDPTPSK